MTTVARDLRRSFFAAATIAVLVVLQSLLRRFERNDSVPLPSFFQAERQLR